MKTTLIDGALHIHSDASQRKFAIFEPARGEKGTLVMMRNGERCEVDLAQLLAAASNNSNGASQNAGHLGARPATATSL